MATLTSTPWGLPQDAWAIADGITKVVTSSHGGLYVDSDLNAQIIPEARDEDGWYEEDDDWAIVVVSFPEHFSHDMHQAAVASVYRAAERRSSSKWQHLRRHLEAQAVEV